MFSPWQHNVHFVLRRNRTVGRKIKLNNNKVKKAPSTAHGLHLKVISLRKNNPPKQSIILYHLHSWSINYATVLVSYEPTGCSVETPVPQHCCHGSLQAASRGPWPSLGLSLLATGSSEGRVLATRAPKRPYQAPGVAALRTARLLPLQHWESAYTSPLFLLFWNSNISAMLGGWS